MSFFKKLKDRMFKSSDKIGSGLDALVAEGQGPEAAPPTPEDSTPPASAAPSVAPKPALMPRAPAIAPETGRRVLDDAMLENLEELLI